MKKHGIAILFLALALLLSACSQKGADNAAKWDCSVSCAGESSPGGYVITYSDTKVASQTGALTFQNRNDFAMTVHLLCEGEEELVFDTIPAGGCLAFLEAAVNKEYTVGVHADVDTNTGIKVFVYDGERSEPYT